jgi:hypothetical protein
LIYLNYIVNLKLIYILIFLYYIYII